MNWNKYFTKTILDRGLKYYERGLVLDVSKSGNKYNATVIGSVPYNVMLRKKSNQELEMSCDCRYAREGQYCKHMAALCYELDELLTDGIDFPESKTKPKIA